MIGQLKLQQKLNNITIDTFPSSLILQGEFGCGKHLFCSLLEEKFTDFSFLYVRDKINYSFIEKAYLSFSPIVYIIEGDRLTDKEQNILLKIFEEPPQNIKIIILINSLAKLIPTIISRAIIWEFEPYTKEELSQFLQDQDISILNYVSTPGQIIQLTKIKIDEINQLCNLLIDKIEVASISNILSLSNKFKFSNTKKNNEEGIEFSVFFRILRECFVNRIKENASNQKYFQMFKLTNKTLQDLRIPNVNDRFIFENYLLKLKYLK